MKNNIHLYFKYTSNKYIYICDNYNKYVPNKCIFVTHLKQIQTHIKHKVKVFYSYVYEYVYIYLTT